MTAIYKKNGAICKGIFEPSFAVWPQDFSDGILSAVSFATEK
jgi:hypothetical protein